MWEDSEVLAVGAKDYIEQRIEASKIAKDPSVEIDEWF
jgi:hypothetical protein